MTNTGSWSNDAPGMDPRQTSSKGMGDYLKALRRRAWLWLLIATVLGGGGVAFTLMQTPVYMARARILIEPPQAIIDGLAADRLGNAAAFANFFSTRVEMISSRAIASRVRTKLSESEWSQIYGVTDPDGELINWINVKPVKNSNLVDISIEGTNPALVAKIVNTTVDEFRRYESSSLDNANTTNSSKVDSESSDVSLQLESAKRRLNDFLKANPKFSADGTNEEQVRLDVIEKAKISAEVEYKMALRNLDQFKSMADRTGSVSQVAQKQIMELRQQIAEMDDWLERQARILRPEIYRASRDVRGVNKQRKEIEQEIDAIIKDEADLEIKRLESIVQLTKRDYDSIVNDATIQRSKVTEQQGANGEFARIMNEIRGLETHLGEIQQKSLLQKTKSRLMSASISVIDEAIEPGMPIRPIIYIQIPVFVLAGIFFGVMTVVGLEFLDQSIRSPEQATQSLDWPLLGVIPRLGRSELVGPEGRFALASEMPGTLFHETFRNLRMGIVGSEGKEPLRGIMVGSAKSGEGKSLVAANLAASCARAGESVCLIDMDLRSPSLDRFFAVPTDSLGLTEVLEGTVPWPRACLQTDIPNLMVMPTGNAEGVPLDILGTAEMHDLLNEMFEHYDRIILDGPPMLGLADSRAVGRFTDGVLLVVQAGSHDPRPLRRIRQLFDQEGLKPIGIVFNGLRERHDDLANMEGTLPKVRPFKRVNSPKSTPPSAVVAAVGDDTPDVDETIAAA